MRKSKKITNYAASSFSDFQCYFAKLNVTTVGVIIMHVYFKSTVFVLKSLNPVNFGNFYHICNSFANR